MVAGIGLVRDEADIIEATIQHMLRHVDGVIVADNGSTDGTREILDSLPIEVVDDPELGHYQSRKTSALAARSGAEWVVPFDADERWLCRDGGSIANALKQLPESVLICEARLFDHVATPEGLGYRRGEALPLRKVACRVREGLVIHEGNHAASYPGVRHPPAVTDLLEVRHFPYRSAEQMIRKARKGAAALAATDLPEEVGKHWRDYGRLTDDQLREVFTEHFYSADPEADGLVFDPCSSTS